MSLPSLTSHLSHHLNSPLDRSSRFLLVSHDSSIDAPTSTSKGRDPPSGFLHLLSKRLLAFSRLDLSEISRGSTDKCFIWIDSFTLLIAKPSQLTLNMVVLLLIVHENDEIGAARDG